MLIGFRYRQESRGSDVDWADTVDVDDEHDEHEDEQLWNERVYHSCI